MVENSTFEWSAFGEAYNDIVNYLMNSKIAYKKIMVTPESFYKIMDAADIVNLNIYNDYFLLFDECDRTMKDVAFRSKILLPMDDFFKFRQKAFISATAVIPTDPRFEEHNFKQIHIKPTYDYAKDINVIIGNNVSLSLKNLIEANKAETLCIFLNSIRAITSVIEDLQIKDESHIFCSREKMYPLRSSGYNCDELITKNLGRINFFTSRFNSAVDILLETKPTVVMVTNLHFASHTMIDPSSEAIQIVGRFRKGVNKIYAISNFTESINAKTPEQCISFLDGCEQSYNDIKILKQSTSNEGAIETLNEALKLVTYSTFINTDGSKNHYMVDNFLYEHSVRTIFQSAENIAAAYVNKYFNPTICHEYFKISDEDYKIPTNGITMKNLVIAIVKTIKEAMDNSELYVIDNRQIILDEVQKCYPEIYEAYFVLGEDELIKNGYSRKQIMESVKAKKVNNCKSNFRFIDDLNDTFTDGFEAPFEIISSMFSTIIQKHGLAIKPNLEIIKDYFEVGPRTTLKSCSNKKGYKIVRSKYNKKS